VNGRPWGPVRRTLLLAALFSLGALALYGGALRNPFHYDDHHGVVNNHALRDLSNVPRFFDPHEGRKLFSPTEPLAVHYRPLLLTTYALDFAVGGESPVGFHLFNIALHVLGALLLLALGRRLGLSATFAAGMALLFLASPFHSEAVNYVSARSSLLSGVLSLGAVLCFVRSRQAAARRLAWLGGALFLALCALLSKEVAVTVPLMFVLYDLLYPPRRPERWGLHGYGLDLGLMAAGLAYLVAAGHAAYFWAVLMGEAGPRGVGENLWLQARVLVEFVRLNLLPAGLSIVHDFPGGFGPAAVASAVLLAAVTAAALFLWRRMPLVAFGWGLFLLFLLPTTLLPMNTPLQESRAYGAAAGLFLAGTALVEALAQRFLVAPFRRRAGTVAFLGVVLLFSAGTVARGHVWSSDLALWSDAVAKAPGAYLAHANLGTAYHASGDLERAVAEYRAAIDLFPGEAAIHSDLGSALTTLGRYDEARAELEAAIAAFDRYAPAHFHYGVLLQLTGDPAGARREYERAVALVPSYVNARVNLGILLARGGDLRDGIDHLEAALAYRPDEESIYGNLMIMYAQAGLPTQAAEAYERAKRNGAASPRLGALYEQVRPVIPTLP
jgi:tetratricopeptide (TPR) repeat protein